MKPEEAHMLTMFGRDHSVIITAIVMMIGMNMMINDQIIMVMQVLWMLTIVQMLMEILMLIFWGVGGRVWWKVG